MKISWDKIGNESFSTRDDIHWLFLEVFGGRKNDVFAVILNDDLPWWTTSFDDDFCQVPNLKLLPSKWFFDQINQKWQKFFGHSSWNFEMKPRIISYIHKGSFHGRGGQIYTKKKSKLRNNACILLQCSIRELETILQIREVGVSIHA